MYGATAAVWSKATCTSQLWSACSLSRKVTKVA